MENKNEGADNLDYKAELEKAKIDLADKTKKLGQAEFKLAKNNMESKKDKSKVFGGDEGGDEGEGAPSAEDVIKATVTETLNKTKADEFLSKHSLNQDEIELARFHLENTIKPSGNPEFDAQAALSIANRGTLVKKTEEMKTAMLNKNQMMSTAGGSGSGGGSSSTGDTDFLKSLTPEQLINLRTVQRMNDKQIEMFIQKRQGQKHTFTP